VPASGFYEWRRRGGGPKRPFLIRRKDRQPMGVAGLWETWTDPETGEVVTSCTIITCAPNALMAELHDRMPVILDPVDYGT
jgi:putative SOS response-associated peptidase YedK